MSTQESTLKRRRKRGVVLTTIGLERLQTAKADAEYAQNQGQRYTLEALSELTGVCIDTLSKVLACEMRVDKQTLKSCFSAFGLELRQEDYYHPDSEQPISSSSLAANPSFSLYPPGGPLPLGSSLYVSRLKAETESYRALEQPGTLIRIKGARRTGKTSLMTRIALQAQQKGLNPVSISFQLADKSILRDLDRLLQWFCVSVGLEMELSPNLDAYWDDLFGSKFSCKIYFEKYILAASQRPLVLILDDVELLFQYINVAEEFLGLLRTWYEDTKTAAIWKPLRMVMAQSPEIYIPLNTNKSPFNVGLAITLEVFSPEDVQSLAKAYGLDWSLESATELCRLLGGQPYLSHLAIDRIWRTDAQLSDVLANPVECQIFSAYLQYLLQQIQQQPKLPAALDELLNDQTSIPSCALRDMHRLQSLGLVVLADDGPKLACELFELYFSTIPNLKNLSYHG